MPSIRFYDGINLTPALPLLVRGYHELLRDGLVQPLVNIFWDDQAFVAFDALPQAIGVLSFAKPWAGAIDIRVGYVLPEFRRRGTYQTLWNSLVTHARDLKVRQINSGVHTANMGMRATAQAQDRQAVAVIFSYQVAGLPP